MKMTDFTGRNLNVPMSAISFPSEVPLLSALRQRIKPRQKLLFCIPLLLLDLLRKFGKEIGAKTNQEEEQLARIGKEEAKAVVGRN